jgi:hypothetical protein
MFPHARGRRPLLRLPGADHGRGECFIERPRRELREMLPGVLFECRHSDFKKEPAFGAGLGREMKMSTFLKRGENRAKSAVLLTVRLAQEHPKYYEAYMRGDYKSVTAAAAGLLKDDVNLRRLKSARRKTTAPEREEFFKWLAEGLADEERAQLRKLEW